VSPEKNLFAGSAHAVKVHYYYPMPLTPLQIEELLNENKDHECVGVGKDHVCVRIESIADLPSRFGRFQVVAFWNNRDGKEHAAFVHGDFLDQEDVPVRMHSECLTGDAIGSLRCDCRDQLEASLRALGSMERGVLFYLRQEGRGIGLINKIRAYELQDDGYDTVEANVALGFRDDERDYSVAAHMVRSLHLRSIRLMTNNPRKINGLTALGVGVTGRIPLVIPPNDYNRFYLQTKAAKSGHILDAGGREHLLEQIDRPVIDGMSAEEAETLQQK
jgi:GTP cyclohydrolase II